MAVRSDERKEFLADILSAAVEGGIGYWAQVRDYTWGTDLGLHSLEGPGAFATVQIKVKGGWKKVNADTIATGIIAIKGPDFQVNHDLRGTILAADAENDATELDAEAADAIVQAALFGELVYG